MKPTLSAALVMACLALTLVGAGTESQAAPGLPSTNVAWQPAASDADVDRVVESLLSTLGPADELLLIPYDRTPHPVSDAPIAGAGRPGRCACPTEGGSRRARRTSAARLRLAGVHHGREERAGRDAARACGE